MFKLTKHEQMIVGFLAAAIVLGTVVREWRARQDRPAMAPAGVATQMRD